MFLILSFAFSLTCKVGIEPLYPNYQEYICKQQSLRGPASVKPIAASVGISKRKAPSKRQKYLRKLLTSSKGFNGLDLNGNGKKDVKITYNSKGFKKISYSLAKNGEFNQFSVYNPSGRLIKETVDQDMDGQVDYFYECKDNVCETRSHYQEGKPNQVVRTTYLSESREYEILERKDGQLKVVAKNKVKDTGRYYNQQERSKYEVMPDWITEGGVCYNCYDENRANFTDLLERFKAIQGEGRGQESLKRYEADDAFFVSQTGYLIHEECFDEARRYGFDVEKTLVDTLVQVFDRLLEIEESVEAVHRDFAGQLSEEEKKQFQLPTIIVKSHIPRLLHLFDKTSWENSKGTLSKEYKFQRDGPLHFKSSTRPCEEDPVIFVGLTNATSENCEFNSELENNRPKLFCQPDEVEKHFIGKARQGYASNPYRPSSEVKSKNGKYHIYGGNNIAVTHDGISETGFKVLFTHEIFHNLGYYDVSNGEIAYSDICVGAIFGKELRMPKNLIGHSTDECFRGDYHRDVDNSASIVARYMDWTIYR